MPLVALLLIGAIPFVLLATTGGFAAQKYFRTPKQHFVQVTSLSTDSATTIVVTDENPPVDQIPLPRIVDHKADEQPLEIPVAAEVLPMPHEMPELIPPPSALARPAIVQRATTRKRSEDDLRRELATAPEFSLSQTARLNLTDAYSKQYRSSTQVRSTVDFDQYTLLHYFPKAIELPIRTAPGCQLGPKEAATLGALAPKLHAYLDVIAPKDETGKRRNPERVREALRQERRGKRPEWLRTEAVPAMVQILMAEDLAIRLILVDMLSEIEGKQATVALAQRAVFDLAPEVRQTALTALRERPREHSRPILLNALRFPWAPAADHAAEALVYLDDKEAAPLLVAQLGKPDPAVPFAIKNGAAVREVVKINHQANCLLCHAPAVGGRRDPVVGIDSLVTVTGGGGRYEGPRRTWSLFIRADVQFLHQDFSRSYGQRRRAHDRSLGAALPARRRRGGRSSVEHHPGASRPGTTRRAAGTLSRFQGRALH
jgi:hypothetical protein